MYCFLFQSLTCVMSLRPSDPRNVPPRFCPSALVFYLFFSPPQTLNKTRKISKGRVPGPKTCPNRAPFYRISGVIFVYLILWNCVFGLSKTTHFEVASGPGSNTHRHISLHSRRTAPGPAQKRLLVTFFRLFVKKWCR